MAEVTQFIGRLRETDDALAAIRAGKHVLVSGRTGIGKTALMRHVWGILVAESSGDCIIWVPKATTKVAFLTLARQLHEVHGLKIPAGIIPPQSLTRARRQGFLPWKDLERSLRRLPVPDLSRMLIDTVYHYRVLVFLESLEVPPSQADFYRDLIEHAQVVAGLDSRNHRVRIGKLLWKFQTTLELKPLTLEESRTLVEHQLQTQPIRFSDARVKARFIQAIAQDSGGIPEAICGMLATAAAEDEITPAKVRSFHHGASRVYLDMTPLVAAGLVVFVALRYISRGLSDLEMMVLAGVGTALFIGLRLFLHKLTAKP